MSRVIDAVAPPRMGFGFRWLLASSFASNIGDGIALAAGPLLVAAQTRDPLLVAFATLLQRLPWVLFGLHAGVIADRLDRRLIMVVVNLARAAVLVVLAMTIVTGVVDVTIVLVAMFVLGTAEVFTDTTAATLLPMIVPRDDLGIGNARLNFTNITLNRLAAPPLGALLFAVGMAVPFAVQAAAMALAAILVSQMAIDMPLRPAERATIRADIVDGMRWLWSSPPVRTLTLTVVAFNITFGAVWSILVLYVTERLGLGPLGFGLFTSVGALGGILGTVVYGRLERSIGRTWIMRCGLIIETGTHLTLAITTEPLVAMTAFFVFGVHEAAWGTTASTIRQRLVPTEFQGRVASVYLVSLFASLVAGAALGGVIAGTWGITAPFWFGFVGSAIILAVIWRQLADIADAE